MLCESLRCLTYDPWLSYSFFFSFLKFDIMIVIKKKYDRKREKEIYVWHGSHYYLIICFYNPNEHFPNLNMKLFNDSFYIFSLMYYKINYVNIKHGTTAWLHVHWIKVRVSTYVCISSPRLIHSLVGVEYIWKIIIGKQP